MNRKTKRAPVDQQQMPFITNGHDKRCVLITGGAGFIGTNVADRFLSEGYSVIVYDNLSRPGVERNLKWLIETHGNRVHVEIADMRATEKLRHVVDQVSKVFHFAAQVAVTSSLTDPIEDFETNARGTLNLLEAVRAARTPPSLIYTSTNKVYGHLKDVKIQDNGRRYEPVERELRENGFNEACPLDFHSPYGCSKGSAEQYVLDYARTFKIPAVVFRMSCIYGVHQFGNEDQGWVAHFLIRALERKPITIYGDGKQVRDVLFIEDLVNAFLLACEHMAKFSGEAFNIGGGATNTISLLELLDLIAEVNGEPPVVTFDSWRPADQQYYVSDIRRFSEATGWRPGVEVAEGVRRVHEWLVENGTVSPLIPNRVGARTIALKEDQQLSMVHSLNQSREPRSKRFWQEANNDRALFIRPRVKTRR